MDTKRIIRALEVWHRRRDHLPAHNAETRPPRPATRPWARAELPGTAPTSTRALTARVEEMAASGLADEVRPCWKAASAGGCTAMQAIGYKELCAIAGRTAAT